MHGARAFGMLCNFNCAFVIVPMMRTHITRIQSTWLAEYVPVHLAWDFHQAVSMLAFVFGCIHGCATAICARPRVLSAPPLRAKTQQLMRR